MEAKFDEPKMLQGFGVDWTGYVPAGGQEWQDMFDAEILPEINQMIDERNKQSSAKVIDGYFYTEADKSLRDAVESLEKVKCLVIERVGKKSELTPKQVTWLTFAMENLTKIQGQIRDSRDEGKSEKELSDEIRFLVYFRDFILEDRVFDKLMFGMFNVADKYRTKVFREGYRLMQNQNLRLETILTMQGEIQEEFRSRFADMLRDMKTAYQEVTVMLRTIRKDNLEMLKRNSGVVNHLAMEMRNKQCLNYRPSCLKAKVEKKVA